MLVVENNLVRMSLTEPARQLEIGVDQVYLHAQWHRIDHVAQVVVTQHEVDLCVEEFARLGARITEEPYHWPTAACDDGPVDTDLEKYMATIEVPGGLLVVAAPMRDGDQLTRHLGRWGAGVPHHIALRVTSVVDAVGAWKRRGYQVGPIADDGELAQVFMMSPTGQIVELISRTKDSGVTFTCENIKELSRAEEELATSRGLY
jgi:hypothetical protein